MEISLSQVHQTAGSRSPATRMRRLLKSVYTNVTVAALLCACSAPRGLRFRPVRGRRVGGSSPSRGDQPSHYAADDKQLLAASEGPYL